MGFLDNISKTVDRQTNTYYKNNYLLYALIILIVVGMYLLFKGVLF